MHHHIGRAEIEYYPDIVLIYNNNDCGQPRLPLFFLGWTRIKPRKLSLESVGVKEFRQVGRKAIYKNQPVKLN